MCYIYSYVNKSKNNKTYIGSRTKAGVIPEEDFNIKYFSSSNNSEFLEDLKSGQLEGQILLEMSDANECVRLENMMIKAYWEQYGKENSYNLHWKVGKINQFSNAGKPAWNRGIPVSDDARKKNSETHKKLYEKTDNRPFGVKNSQYGKRGELSAHWGKRHSNEAKQKMSIAARNRAPMSIETRVKIGLRSKGKPLVKYQWLTPSGEIKIMSVSNATRWHPDWLLLEEK